MAIADKLNLLRSTKAEIKSAIETKGQQVGDAAFSDYPEKILAIETGTPLPELTNPGAAGDLLSGKQLIGPDGQAITGTMQTVVQATPSISVSSGGLITASATQGAGYVAAGSKSATQQLSTQSAKSVRPSTSQQTAVSSGKYTTGAVTVEGSSYLIPGNIRSGVNIFGVTGNYEGDTPQLYTISDADLSQSGVKLNLSVDVPIKQIHFLRIGLIRIQGVLNGFTGQKQFTMTPFDLFYPYTKTNVYIGIAISRVSNQYPIEIYFTATARSNSIEFDFGNTNTGSNWLESISDYGKMFVNGPFVYYS